MFLVLPKVNFVANMPLLHMRVFGSDTISYKSRSISLFPLKTELELVGTLGRVVPQWFYMIEGTEEQEAFVQGQRTELNFQRVAVSHFAMRIRN